MKPYRALAFFDLDGTLLDAHSNITLEIRHAMDQLKENKVLPIIATGRTEHEVYTIRQNAGITSNICMNGMFIRAEQEIIYSNHMEIELCERFAAFNKKQNDLLSFYNERQTWCTGHDANLIHAYEFIHSKVPPIDPTGYLKKQVNMFLVFGTNEQNDQAYHDAFPELTFYRNSPFSIDTVKKGISKGSAVQEFKKQLGLDIPTFGFGDGPNDLDLLKACDHKIAMGNGRDEVKELADFITTENTNHGIVNALKHFDLI